MTNNDRSNYFKEYEHLKSKLLNLKLQQSIKTIMITACNEGDGVSTTARNLAYVLASGAMAKVLLVELNSNEQCIQASNDSEDDVNAFKNAEIDNANINDEANNDETSVKFSLRENIYNFLKMQYVPLQSNQNGFEEKIFRVSMKPDSVSSQNLFQSLAFKFSLDRFKEQFDYVILDAPPVFSSAGCLGLGAQADGVILVLRSEHTRQEAAKNAKYQLEAAGAKLFGAVINMKKYYIPNFIYRRL